MNAKANIPTHLPSSTSDQRNQGDDKRDGAGGIRRRLSFDPATLLNSSTISDSFSAANGATNFSSLSVYTSSGGGSVAQEQHRRVSVGDLSFIVRGGVGNRADLHSSSEDGRKRTRRKDNSGADADVNLDVDMVPSIRHDSRGDAATANNVSQSIFSPSTTDVHLRAATSAAPSIPASPSSLSLASSLSIHSPLYSSSSVLTNPPVAINTAITLNNSSTASSSSVTVGSSITLAPIWGNAFSTTSSRDSVPPSLSRPQDQLPPHPLFHHQTALPSPFSSSSSPSLHHLHLSDYQQQQKHDDSNNKINTGRVSPLHTAAKDSTTTTVGLSRDDASTITSHSQDTSPIGTLSLLPRDDLLSATSPSTTTTTIGSQAKSIDTEIGALPPLPSSEHSAASSGSRRTQQSSIEPSSHSPYLRDFSPIDSRRRQPPAWSIPSPPSKSRSHFDSSTSSARPHYDQHHHHDNFSIHLPPPSTLSPPTTASTLSSYTSSPYDTPSSAAAAAAAAFKHISPFTMASASWASPPRSHYQTPSPMPRRESFTPRTRFSSSSSPHTSDLPWEASSSYQQHHIRSDSNPRSDKRFHSLYPAHQQQSTLTTTSANSNSSMPLMTSMVEDRLSLHRLSPPDDMDDFPNTNNKRNSRSSFSSDRSLYESLPPLHQHQHQHQHNRSATSSTSTTTGVEGSFGDRSRVSTSESGSSQIPPPLQRVHHVASKGPIDCDNTSFSSPPSLVVKDHSKKWTSTESVYNRKVLSARGTPKGPLPMNVQISLLSSVLRHDPFNCPIRRTTQVWEAISREQGVRARTCARRYDNIIQASIAGRERPIGTEEQIATKKKLLDQLFVMMNQPQALVRMQKKKRYRSEEADRQLLLETIRLNPFAQKMGQVAKAWEDVRDALKMQVHARQCIRRVNRMIKPYQLRERMYHGNIPDEMKEENDELIKQVIQMMQASGQGGSLEEDDEEDAGQSQDEDDSASDSDDQEHESHQSRSRHSSDTKVQQGNGEEIDEGADSTVFRPSTTAMDISLSPRSPTLSLVQSPQTVATTPTASESTPLAPSESTTPVHKSTRRPRLSNQSSLGHSHDSNKRSLVDRSSDEMTGVIPSPYHPFESEFKPQRLWGSHPYSKERSSRASHGTHSQRPSRSSSLQSDLHHRPSKYTRSSSRDLLRDSMGDSRGRSMVLQGPSTTPGDGSNLREYYYDQQNNIYTQSNSNSNADSHHHHHLSQLMPDGQITISSAQQQGQLQGQPATQLYRAILGEFQVVQQYLGKMEDQRERDKVRQAEMGYLVDKLQFQLQQQQQSIQDLQVQLQHQQQHQQQQGTMAVGQGQGQGQGQVQEHLGQSPSQPFDHRRAGQSRDHDSPRLSFTSNVPDQHQRRSKSLEDQE